MSASIQPIVLTGGASERFGSDKLRAAPDPSRPDNWLVDRPIAALRHVFGNRVFVVGECDADVAARADGVLWDDHPGCGPIGGILSALERTGGDVFVLAGDLPQISKAAVRSVLIVADASPQAWAVLATASGLQPCIGLYRQAMAPALRRRLEAGERSLHDAAPPERLVRALVHEEETMNMNTLGDLRAVVAKAMSGLRSGR